MQELLEKELNESKDTLLGDFVRTLIQSCRNQQVIAVGDALAAAFDLLVGVFYYQKVPSKGWISCSFSEEQIYFPYVNACPRCTIEGRFVHHKALKSQSANIGAATIKALVLFTREWFELTGSQLTVLKGEEPVDLLIYDKLNQIILLAEVKSAPLLTLPLVLNPDRPSEELNTHEATTVSRLLGAELGVLLPVYGSSGWQTEAHFFSEKFDGSDLYFIRMITEKVREGQFWKTYLISWQEAFRAYATKNKEQTIFWLTNGCGVPSPVPPTWPDRVGTGRETISDGKTSVGLDRTDDIKKGVYQLLKLRMAAINQDYTVKVAILSNTHAARHHEEYIGPIENVMWLILDTEAINVVGDLPLTTPVYNLFDGIITFTKTYTRDGWIKEHLNFNG